eukprot:Rmarinus@m.13776
MRVAVVGSGAAGLCAIRHLQTTCTVVAFEQTKTVGGTWAYTDETDGAKQSPVHSSMYKSLRTNLPKEIMAFRDFPFSSDLPSYIHHTAVHEYLQVYAREFGLTKCIRFGEKVVEVYPENPGCRTTSWKVNTVDLHTNESNCESFDHVVVCNGHYSAPAIPDLNNADKFRGSILHSHNYRDPSFYEDKVVCVIGAAASGTDISREIASTAKLVYLCHRKASEDETLHPATGGTIQVRPPVVGYSEEGDVILCDNRRITAVDAMVFCTGYHYVFPFLRHDTGINIHERVVRPLYRHLFHIDTPTLSFIGLPWRVVPFPLFDYQAEAVAQYCRGNLALPPKEEMLR